MFIGIVIHYESLTLPVRTLLDRLGLAHRGKHGNGKSAASGQPAATASDPSKTSDNDRTGYVEGGKKMDEGKGDGQDMVDGAEVDPRTAFEADISLEEQRTLLDLNDTQAWEDNIAWQIQNLDKHRELS